MVSLPSQRTLRDYTHYIPPTVGFSFEIDQQLIAAAQVEKLEDWQKYVIVILDEMHIKQDLVYEKHSGEFIGVVYQVAIPLCSVSLFNSHWRSDV